MGMSLSGARPIVTGRVPSGTSFNTAPSNCRTSLDIFFCSPPAEAGQTLPGVPFPDLQATEHAFRLRKDPKDDDTHVVDTAVFIGQIDEPVRRVLGRSACQQRTRDFRISHHP